MQVSFIIQNKIITEITTEAIRLLTENIIRYINKIVYGKRKWRNEKWQV